MASVDHAFRAWIRTLPCVVAVANESNVQPHTCLGRVQFCHVIHAGMGGCNAPADVGNGWPACAAHHTEAHLKGLETFRARHQLPPIATLAEHLGHQYRGLEFGAPMYPDDWAQLAA